MVTASLDVHQWMRRLSRAHTLGLYQGWWFSNIHKYINVDTFVVFWFIPLSVVFDLDTAHLAWLIISAFPVFSVGLAEDLGYPMSPKSRLLASAASGLLVLFGFKVWVAMIGIPGVDVLLSFAPFAILFTIFATVGVVNAFNLIDGLNGLSGYVAISVSLSLSLIAVKVNDNQTVIFLALLISAVLGFMALNFPLGRFFLGMPVPISWSSTCLVCYFTYQ